MKDLRSTILWWAAGHRINQDRPFIIAITGSIAKTSTKEAVGAVLNAAFPRQVRVGFGNLNTYLGLPLSILGFKIDFYNQNIRWQWLLILIQAVWRGLFGRLPKFLVLELGADKPGDIEELTHHIQPDIGILTVVGEAHLMNYQSAEQLADEKGKLLKAIKPAGVAIINKNDPHRERHLQKIQTPFLEIDVPTAKIAEGIAQKVGEILKLDPDLVLSVLDAAWQPEGRMQLTKTGRYTIIDDSYNASPLSMKAALEKLSAEKGRRVAILGSMFELGAGEVRMHEEVGELAHKLADVVIGVGELAKHYATEYWYPSSDLAAKAIVALNAGGGKLPSEGKPIPLQEGDIILVKGSHGVRMNKIVEALKND